MLRVYYAEILKYKRTSALFLAIGIPFAINGLFLLAYTLNEHLHKAKIADRWELLLSGVMGSWLQIFLPLGLGILAALSLGLEHQDNQWKQLLTLGIPRVQIYVAKWLAILGLVLLGTLALAIGSLLAGCIITGFQDIPWVQIFKAPLLTFVGSLAIISIQTWLATRFKAFAVSIGIALFGTIAGGLVVQSPTYWKYLPWTYPAGASGMPSPNDTLAIGLSVFVALAFLLLAARDFQKRDML
jgi:lantibiotic transport system permease protein